ncbi:PAS domain S-box protein [Alkalinema sp. FACHB-956]|uniref:PAS domain S-box protein n=1 Tax=Alkalinema sp. FACHB-956 TaxID=2692768 RepID=UPI001686E06D|nr:PAS domain S-box protein [Alkalinema sp. FACHB-956]MBD2329696.1 PAS domain S-box protein [Alkalinema sp. FACHB-956]
MSQRSFQQAPFETFIESAHQRLANLLHRVHMLEQGGEMTNLVMETVGEVAITLEELEGLAHKLRQYNQELIQARQSVEQERQRYQDLFNFAPDGYLVTNELGHIQEANQATANLLRVYPEDLLERSLATFVHPADLPIYDRVFQRLRQVGQVQGYELRIHRAENPHSNPVENQREHPTDNPTPPQPEHWVELSVAVIQSQDGTGRSLRWLMRDITDRKRMEFQLKTSSIHLKDILNHASAAILSFRGFLNNTWHIDYCSAGCAALFGYTSDEMIADQTLWGNRVLPEDLAEIVPAIFESLRKDNAGQVDYRFRRKDDTLKWMNANFTGRWDEAEQCWFGTGVLTDITDRKQLELQLQKSTTQLSAILDNAIASIFQVRVYPNFELQYDYQSAGAEAVFGYTAEELMADNYLWMSRVHPEDWANRLVPGFQDVFSERSNTIEYRLYRKDGELRWLTVTFASRQDEAAGCWIVTGISTDITAFKEAEASLKKSETLYRTLASHFPNGAVCLFDGDLRFTLADGLGLVEAGLSKEQLEGKTIWEALPADFVAQVEPFYRSALAGKTTTTELMFGAATYQAYHLPITNDCGEIIAGMVMTQNITDRKRREEQLRLLESVVTNIHEAVIITEAIDTEAIDTEAIETSAIDTEAIDTEAIEPIVDETATLHPGLSVENAQSLEESSMQSHASNSQAGNSQAGNSQDNNPYPPHHRIVYVNPAFSAMTGYSAAEVLQKTPRFLQGQCTDRQALAQLRLALQSGQPTQLEFINYRKDHSQFWADLSMVPIYGSDDRLNYWVSVRRDVTDRKQAATTLQQLNEALEQRVQERTQALQESEERFRHAFDHAVTGVALVALEGRWLKVNPALCHLLGYSEHELQQFDCQDVLHPDDFHSYSLILHQLISDEITSHQSEHRYRHKQGYDLWVICSLSLVRDSQGHPLYFVKQILDITERRAIDQMKDEFIAIASHELRTPLTSMRGSLGLVASGVLDDDPKMARELIQVAINQNDRLTRLVNDMLDLERLDARTAVLQLQPCAVTALVQQAIETVYPLAEEAAIAFHWQPAELQVQADPDRIVQVLVNLLGNAVKFSPSQTTITIRVTTASHACNAHLLDRSSRQSQLSQNRQSNSKSSQNRPPQNRPSQNQEFQPADPPPVYGLFSIQDQGRGIPADKLDMIFGRFQQVDSSDSRNAGGTGLGLAICQKIVQQHTGKIWASSTPGQGSTFYFTLPLATHSP